MTRALGILVVALASAAVGCGDPLVARQRVVDTRILAVRADVIGDPGRATPRPGEDVEVRVRVAGPRADAPAVFWRLEACLVEPTTTGVPRCRQRLALVEGPSAEGQEPSMAWTTPDARDRLMVVGLICDQRLEPLAAPWPEWLCSGGKTNLFHAEIAVASDDEEDNLNPDLSLDTLSLDGDVWGDGGCEGRAPLVVPSWSEHRVAWSIAASNRGAAAAGREELLLSHFSDDGSFDHAFSTVDSDESDPASIGLSWLSPYVPPGERRTVRFHFVARDRRGGADWTSRSLCVDGNDNELELLP